MSSYSAFAFYAPRIGLHEASSIFQRGALAQDALNNESYHAGGYRRGKEPERST